MDTWEAGVSRFFGSRAAFWGWDGVYFEELIKEKVQEGVDMFKCYLGEGNPLIKDAEEGGRSVLSQVSSCISAHSPAIRPKDRGLHQLIPVRCVGC